MRKFTREHIYYFDFVKFGDIFTPIREVIVDIVIHKESNGSLKHNDNYYKHFEKSILNVHREWIKTLKRKNKSSGRVLFCILAVYFFKACKMRKNLDNTSKHLSS